MGQITKSITIEVPANVIYDAMKGTDSSRYTSDLRKSLTPPVHYTKDIPNSLLACETSSWGTKLEVEYAFRPLGESSCEVTIKYDFRFALEASVRQSLIQEINGLLMLEFGYKAGSRKITGH